LICVDSVEPATSVITKSLVKNSGIVVLPVLHKCITFGAALGELHVQKTKKLIPALFIRSNVWHIRTMLRTDINIQFFHSVMYMGVMHKNTAPGICILPILDIINHD
jgi:hypothetical protein